MTLKIIRRSNEGTTMNRQNYNAPDQARQASLTAATPAPSDRLYQLAALTVVLFMLATML